MSLKFLSAQDISTFANTVASGGNDPPVAGGPSTGLAEVRGLPSGSNQGGMVYHIGRDKYFAVGRVSTVGGDGTGYFMLDPFLTKTAPPNSDFRWMRLAPDPNVFNLIVDQFNPDSGNQRLFTADGNLGKLVDIDPNTLLTSLTPSFTGPNGDFVQSSSDLGGGNGFWSTTYARALVFTGYTDGIPGETRLTGTNVYPDGLYLVGMVGGQLEGNLVNRSFGWVDLRTRRLEGLLGGGVSTGIPSAFPLEVSATPAGNSSEAPIGGDQFFWVPAQYLPDSDATFTQPKGQLFFISAEEIPTVMSPSPGDTLRIYVRFTDYNPFGLASASGVPSRVHGRIRQTSRIVPVVSPQFNLAGQADIGNPFFMHLIFDPLRRRIVMGMYDDLNPIGAANNSTIGFYSTVVDPAIVTSPAARDVPRTNDITTFETFAGGDIGEAVSGLDVAWVLDRRSTEGEVVDASGGIAATTNLANPPIDSDSGGNAELVITADGTDLVDGVDYQVNNLTTGEIQWITDQSGATLVTATYNHRTTGATPAHGTLLNAQTQTDDNGNAETRVSYPDDDSLVGTLDNLGAEEA